MANFCSNCGKPLRVGARFCGNCGAKISATLAETRAQNSDGANDYNDMLAAGAGLLAGVTAATATNSAQAQPTNVAPPAGDVNGFFGFTSNGLQDMTGSVDVTNIVAHVARDFGVENISEYADIVADGAEELVDAASDIIGDAAGDAAGSIVDSLFDLI